jgi:hypothetical protein
MAKILLSMQDLQARAMAEIRKQPGCSSVRMIAINRAENKRAENNWSMCVCYPLAMPMQTRRRAPRLMSSTSCATTTI